MKLRVRLFCQLLLAAFILQSVAIVKFGRAVSLALQEGGGSKTSQGEASSTNKQNVRPERPVPGISANDPETPDVTYSYEFTQPQFYIRHIVIEHGPDGRGKITFERLNEETPITDPIELSPAALTRILALWKALRFLDSNANYQSDRQYPHLGTMRLRMVQDKRERTTEFNWTGDRDASALISEYRRAADQAILVFDISVARENQPLNAPKLMEQLESLLRRQALSDPRQLVPLLTEITTDEHLPLIARNHAARLVKVIQK